MQTQTIESAFHLLPSIQISPKHMNDNLRLSNVDNQNKEEILLSPVNNINLLPDIISKKDKKNGSRKNYRTGSKFNNPNFKSDDEDGYKINNQMNEFKYQMIQRRNTMNELNQEEHELDEYIKFFENAIDENNYEIIENMEMLYSCTAHYVSYYFSFESFENQHDQKLKKNLVNQRMHFPDLFTRFID